MRTAIQREVGELDAISSLYGMGSFFRGEVDYRDIDLVAVIDCPRCDLMAKGDEVRTAFAAVGDKFSVIIDLTILTPREFAERPLCDMDRLELLFPIQSVFGAISFDDF